MPVSNDRGLRNASEYADAAWAEMHRPKLVTIKDGHFCVHNPELYGQTYDIPIGSCSSRDDILRWVRQLSEKQWVSMQVIEDFAKVMIRHFGVQG